MLSPPPHPSPEQMTCIQISLTLCTKKPYPQRGGAAGDPSEGILILCTDQEYINSMHENEEFLLCEREGG